jgi:hypothetical protein
MYLQWFEFDFDFDFDFDLDVEARDYAHPDGVARAAVSSRNPRTGAAVAAGLHGVS